MIRQDTYKKPEPTVLHCVNASIVPKQAHWGILSFRTITIYGRYPDDQNETHTVSEYTAYTQRSEWEAEIVKRMTSTDPRNHQNFTAIEAKPAKIEVQVKVNVDIT